MNCEIKFAAHGEILFKPDVTAFTAEISNHVAAARVDLTVIDG
jgi:hypothetical protein